MYKQWYVIKTFTRKAAQLFFLTNTHITLARSAAADISRAKSVYPVSAFLTLCIFFTVRINSMFFIFPSNQLPKDNLIWSAFVTLTKFYELNSFDRGLSHRFQSDCRKRNMRAPERRQLSPGSLAAPITPAMTTADKPTMYLLFSYRSSYSHRNPDGTPPASLYAVHLNDFQGQELVQSVTIYLVASRLRNSIPNVHRINDCNVRAFLILNNKSEDKETPGGASKFRQGMQTENSIQGSASIDGPFDWLKLYQNKNMPLLRSARTSPSPARLDLSIRGKKPACCCLTAV